MMECLENEFLCSIQAKCIISMMRQVASMVVFNKELTGTSNVQG